LDATVTDLRPDTSTPKAERFISTAIGPRYIGGILEMLNARLFNSGTTCRKLWRTGKPQNEIKHGQKGMFEELYSELPRSNNSWVQ